MRKFKTTGVLLPMKYIFLILFCSSICFADSTAKSPTEERELALKQTIEKTNTPQSKVNYISFLLNQNRIADAETVFSKLEKDHAGYQENKALGELIKSIKLEPDLDKRKKLIIGYAFKSIESESKKLDETIKKLDTASSEKTSADKKSDETSVLEASRIQLSKEFDLEKLLPLQTQANPTEFEIDVAAEEYLKSKDYAKAESYLVTNIKLYNQSPLLVSRMVQVLLENNREIQAHKIVRSALVAHPNEIQLQILNKYIPLIVRAKTENKLQTKLEMQLMLAALAEEQYKKLPPLPPTVQDPKSK